MTHQLTSIENIAHAILALHDTVDNHQRKTAALYDALTSLQRWAREHTQHHCLYPNAQEIDLEQHPNHPDVTPYLTKAFTQPTNERTR